MNALNLTNVQLSEYIGRFMPVYPLSMYIQLSLRPIGIITSVVNILIFSHEELLAKSSAFSFLLAMSLIDFFYLAMLLYLNLIRTFCHRSSTMCGD